MTLCEKRLAGGWINHLSVISDVTNFNQSDQSLAKLGRKKSLPRRKVFSVVLCSSFNEEILSSSDVTDAITASTVTSSGAAIVCSRQVTSMDSSCCCHT